MIASSTPAHESQAIQRSSPGGIRSSGIFPKRRLIGRLMIDGAIICTAIALVSYLRTSRFYRDEIRVQGTVVRVAALQESDGPKSYPVFRFRDARGTSRTITSDLGSDPAKYKIGDTVDVSYQPINPADAQIADFYARWLLPMVTGLIAGFLLPAGLLLRYWPNRRVTENETTAKGLTFAFVVLLGAPAVHAADWPQWQGADRTGSSKETGLLKEWPAEGPPLAWKVKDLGGGYSAPAIAAGRIYGMSKRDGKDVVWALSEADGKSVWATPLEAAATQNMPQGQEGPGCTPTVDGDRLYVVGTAGEVTCLSVSDGKVVWRRSMVRDFAGILPRWAYRESPLIDGDKLICTPGAPDATLVALDKLTGATLWKTDVPTELEGGGFANAGAGYASAIAIDFEGQRQYIQITAKALIGVAAADGKLLWSYRKPANNFGINCTTPLYRDGLVFASSAYNAGGGAVKLSKDAAGAVTATEVFFSQSLQNAHGGVVETDGFVYLSRDPGILTCVELKTGKVLWSERQPGKGSVAYADGQLYCRAEAGTGTVYLVDAKSTGYVERGHFDPPDRTTQSAWAHPVIANGKLYIRDQGTLLVYNIKAANP